MTSVTDHQLCPSQLDLQAFTLGECELETAEVILQHCDHCLDCRNVLDELEQDSLFSDPLIDQLSQQAQVRHQLSQYDDELQNAIREIESALAFSSEDSDSTCHAEISWPLQCDQDHPLRIREYQLFKPLAAGGMGTVYQAFHTHLKRNVAIKLLPGSKTRDAAWVQRFLQEIEAAGQVQHPNIVLATDAGQVGGIHYLVMEFVDGEDLERIRRREGRLAPQLAIDVVLRVAAGLQAVHAQGLIHRDIKPSNIMVSTRGEVKVLDLGLACVHSLRSGNRSTGSSEGSDASSCWIGTIGYMSPEQIREPQSVDYRSDIYSLGCTLFGLLTGRPPYLGETRLDVANQHRFAAIPRLREFVPQASRALDKVLHRMMSKDVTQRPQSMTEVAALLSSCKLGKRHQIPCHSQCLKALESRRRTIVRARRHPIVWGIATVALVLIAVLFFGQPADPPRPNTNLSPTPSPIQIWSADEGQSVTFIESQNRLLVGVHNKIRQWNTHDDYELPTIPIGQLTGLTGYIRDMTLSPNQKQVAIVGLEASIVIYDLTGERLPEILCSDQHQQTSAAFSPQGDHLIAGSTDGRVRSWNLENGFLHEFDGQQRGPVTRLVVSPNGRDIVSGDDTGRLYLWNRITRRLKRSWVAHEESVTATCFSRCGEYVVSGSADSSIKIWHVGLDSLGRFLGRHEGRVTQIRFGESGNQLFSSAADGTVATWDFWTSQKTQELHHASGSVTDIAIGRESIFSVTGEGRVSQWQRRRLGHLIPSYDIRLRETKRGHHGRLTSVAVGSDYWFTASDDTSIIDWRNSAKRLTRWQGHNEYILDIMAIPEREELVSSDACGTVLVWDTRSMTAKLSLPQGESAIEALAYAPGSHRFVIADHASRITCYTVDDWQPIWKHGASQSAITHAEISPDGESLATTGDYNLRLWKLDTGKHQWTFKTDQLLYSADYSRDNQRIAVGGAKGTILVWRVDDAAVVDQWQAHETAVTAVAYSPNGELLISTDRDGNIAVWHAKTHGKLAFRQAHKGVIRDAEFLPHGNSLVTVGHDQTARRWEIARRKRESVKQ